MKENRTVNRLAKLLFVLIIGFLVIMAVPFALAIYVYNNMGKDGGTHTSGGVEVVESPWPAPYTNLK